MATLMTALVTFLYGILGKKMCILGLKNALNFAPNGPFFMFRVDVVYNIPYKKVLVKGEYISRRGLELTPKCIQST